MARTFVQMVRHWLPSWILEGEGQAVADTLAQMVDENVTRFRQGVEARFPSKAAALGMDDALAKLSKDRGIPRGRSETAEHFANRLIAWRAPLGHRVRGSAFALLEQVSEYFGGVACRTIDRSGNLFERDPRGVERYEYTEPCAWDARPAEELRRFWIVIDGTTIAHPLPDLGDPSLWGGSLGAAGRSLGQDGTSFDDTQAMRALMTGLAWRPAATQPEWIVVMLDPELSIPLSPGTPAAEIAIDATWEHWSRCVAGVQTPTRDPRCRYWSLDPLYNNDYAGNPLSFCTSLPVVSGALYSGDTDAFPATITRSDGTTYAGNPDNFPATIRLLDDGDPSP